MSLDTEARAQAVGELLAELAESEDTDPREVIQLLRQGSRLLEKLADELETEEV